MRKLSERWVKDVGTNIILTITVIVFFVMFIRAFYNIYEGGGAEKIYLNLSSLVAIYLLNYVIYFLAKYILHKYRRITKTINYILILNLMFIGLIIVYLLNIEKPWSIYFHSSFLIMLYASGILPCFIAVLLGYVLFKR